MNFSVEKQYFTVKPHSQLRHLYQIEVNNNSIRQYLNAFEDVNAQRLEYVPYMRFALAHKLRELLGFEFQNAIRGILQERVSGGFTVGIQETTSNKEDYLKFATAITHLVGATNFDSMTNTYYASFSVTHTDNSDTYLRQPYRTLEFHTDGTFVAEKTDWLAMMKWEEGNAIGGESRLLHLDDWDQLEEFRNHPLAAHKFQFSYAHKKSKNTGDVVYNTTFYEHNNAPCIRFNDQATQPETIEQAMYLKKLSESMEHSPGVQTLPLPVGDMVMLNNHFWLHGREAFKPNPELYRELMRQRGCFAEI